MTGGAIRFKIFHDIRREFVEKFFEHFCLKTFITSMQPSGSPVVTGLYLFC